MGDTSPNYISQKARVSLPLPFHYYTATQGGLTTPYSAQAAVLSKQDKSDEKSLK